MEKRYERVHRRLRVLLHHPVAGVRQRHRSGIRGYELNLLGEGRAVCLLSTDGQNRHGEFRL